MRVEVIPAVQLDETLIRRWREIQHLDPALASPYFCPEFTRAAGEVYPNTFVGVIEESAETVGFLPFERRGGRAGRGIAQFHADHQGAIIDSSIRWNAEELLRGCGLSSIEFEHLIASQLPFQQFHTQASVSHVIDLRGGAEVYRREHGNRRLRERARQAAREIGPLRFEMASNDPALLSAVLEMKRQQYARMGVNDVLSDRATRTFLERLHGLRSQSFAGVLSVLYMGDAIAAAHFGLRSDSVWHWWFPVYDEALVKYSPGLLLLQNMVDVAEGLGISMIDLGYGDEPYKLRVANSSIPLASALVGASWPASCRRYKRNIAQYLRGTRLEAPARALYRGIANSLRHKTVSSEQATR